MADYLAVDIGNSTIHLGVFQGEKLREEKKIPATGICNFPNWWKENFSDFQITQGALASVNPRVTNQVVQWIQENLSFSPLVLGQDLPIPMEMDVKASLEVGADRIINGFMAYRQHKKALLVVDFGTAITIDVVSEKGVYLGGIIAPGLELSARCLFEQTALLPLIQIQSPPEIIGKNTLEAISSGIFWGAVGMVEMWIQKIYKHLLPPPSLVIATGGGAVLMFSHCPSLSLIDTGLTLRGIALIGREGG